MAKKPAPTPGKEKMWLLGILGALTIVIVSFLFMQSGEPSTSNVEVAADLARHQKVTENSTLHMAFPTEMDRESVEENLESVNELTGEIDWEENTLVFEPAQALEKEVVYSFYVPPGTLTASGRPLNEALDFSFTVEGPPTMVSHFPLEDSLSVSTDAKIVLVFDRAMIPLSTVQGRGAKKYAGNWPVTISPNPPGRWRWLSTSTIEFEPKDGLKLATEYTVDVPDNLKSVIGDTTAEGKTWSFATSRPKIMGGIPSNLFKLAGPKQDIVLTFNQEIELNSARKNIKLFDGENDTLLTIITHVVEESDNEKITNKKRIHIKPKKPLALNSHYTLTALPGIKGVEGALGTEEDFEIKFSTVGDLKVMRHELKGKSTIEVDFSNPINDETLKENIRLEPEVEGWEDLTIKTNSWDKNTKLRLRPRLDHGATYTLTLGAAIEDQFQQELGEDVEFTFTTPDADPSVSALNWQEFSVYEKDKAPVFPVKTINIKDLHFEFARLPFNEFLAIRKSKRNYSKEKVDLSNYLNHDTWKLDLEKTTNEFQTMAFDVEKVVGKQLGPGIYGFSVQSPQYLSSGKKPAPILSQRYFTLTDTALTLKFSGQKALVWAVNMQTGDPISGATIKFHNLNGEVVVEGRSDEEGFFETNLNLNSFQVATESLPEFWVTASKGDDFAFVGSQWNSGLNAWNFGLWEDFQYASENDYNTQGYLYTERQIYRPGDDVYFKGILRLLDKTNGELILPNKTRSAHVTVQDSKYNDIYEKTLDINEYGAFSAELPIDKGAPLGSYTINVSITPDDNIDSNYVSHSFAVLEFRKPEFQIEMSAQEEDYFDDDDVTFEVQGDYFFGAPMNGAKVEWRATSLDYFFNRYTDDWYSFALEGAWCWWECSRGGGKVTEGETELNDTGHGEITFPVDVDDKSVAQVITVHADITDTSNQVVSSSASVPVHKAKLYVGVQMEDHAINPNEDAGVKVITLHPDGSPASGQKVKVKLFSRTWNSVKKKSVDGDFYFDNEPKDKFIRDVSVRTDDDGKAVAKIRVNEGGSYRIVAEIKDEDGRKAAAGASLYVFSETYFNWPHSNNDRMEMVADKPEYKVGDTAQILIKSPYQGENVRALVTVERENVLSREIVDIESNAQPFEVEITEDLIPNAYVSAVVIKPRDGDLIDEEGNDTGLPAFKMGYVKLKVETSLKELEVDLTTDKEKYLPGETVRAKIVALDSEGNPIQGEFSVGVVDMSLIALTGFSLPDLVRRFYADRGLGVRTAQLLTNLVDALKAGSKGGGGGPGGEESVRKDFRDTAFWIPSVETDENGEATVEFSLPDNLTTWQVLAIGNTKESQFGARATTFIETKSVILRPHRPRFAVMDDEMVIGATVHNFLDDDQRFDVTFEGTGFHPRGEGEQTAMIKAGDHATFNFPITVSKTEAIEFHFTAVGEDGRDEIIENIPVYTFGTPQSVATSGITEDQALEKVYVPPKDEAEEGTVKTTLAPTLATYLPSGLDYLHRFPYGCAEQTVSSFLGNVALSQLQGFDAFRIVDDAELEKTIISSLEKLYEFQRGDGGFGYWKTSRRSSSYLSVYILHALNLTQDAGYNVDSNVISRVQNYLSGVLRSKKEEKYISRATRAYILFVLSEDGKAGGNVSLANNLYDDREDLSLFSKAHLAMTMENYGQHKKAKAITDDMMKFIRIDSRGAYFREHGRGTYRFAMNTNQRTTALVLQALIRIDGNNNMIPKITRRMLDVRKRGHWDTTQSTIASIFALIDFLKSTGELDADYNVNMSINGSANEPHTFNKDNILTKHEILYTFQDLKADDFNTFIIEKTDGPGRVYYDMVMDYFYTAETIPPTEQGMSITREMERLDAENDSVEVQGTYKIKLTITAPEDRYYVGVESPLPAGFEIIDLSLNTTQQHLSDEIESDWRTSWIFDHKELRDDRVFLFADFLRSGVYEYEYLVRATTAGNFKYRPARTWEMYFPETFGQTEGGWFEIKE